MHLPPLSHHLVFLLSTGIRRLTGIYYAAAHVVVVCYLDLPLVYPATVLHYLPFRTPLRVHHCIRCVRYSTAIFSSTAPTCHLVDYAPTLYTCFSCLVRLFWVPLIRHTSHRTLTTLLLPAVRDVAVFSPYRLFRRNSL